MIIMHAVLLFILCAISIIVTAGATVVYLVPYPHQTLEEDDKNKKIMIWAWVVFISLLTWTILASTAKPIVTYSEKLVPTKVTNDNKTVYTIVYQTDYGDLKVVNLNDMFHQQISPTDTIVVTHYKKGPYYGVSFAGTIAYEEKIELIRP